MRTEPQRAHRSRPPAGEHAKPLTLVLSLSGSLLLSACGAVASSAVDGPVMRYPNRTFSSGGMAAEIAGVLDLENGCLYLVPDEVADRYPILWPKGTRWNADIEAVITADGVELQLGDEVWGGGGYLYVDDVRRLAGDEAAGLAERCLDNTFGEVAVVNNQRDAIGRPVN